MLKNLLLISILLFISILLLAACAKPIPCKYKVGDKVRTITGDIFVVKRAQEGAQGAIKNQPVLYIVTEGPGWTIKTNKTGIKLTKGTYMVLENEIVGIEK